MSKTKGYYFGNYNIKYKQYTGTDFSSECFVFPGQGGAFPGMYKEEFIKFKVIQEKFTYADTLAKKFNLSPISDYILHPDKVKKENIPRIANLALFTIEMAFFDILISQKIIPKMITGHSFGEYMSITASGVLSYEEMFEVIYYRDYFSPVANSCGFLVAINSEEKNIKQILEGLTYSISNINSPKQTVIAVTLSDINLISKRLEEQQIKFKILTNVPQPYHSPLMVDTQNKVIRYFQNTKKASIFLQQKIKKPKIPFYSSVLHKVIDKKSFNKNDIKEIFFNQLTTQVNFIQQIKNINNLGFSNFLEISNKKIFSTFIEDIFIEHKKEVKTNLVIDYINKRNINEKDTDNIINIKTFENIRNIISKATGYEIKKITPKSRFQDDLGIDSIKKTDIILNIFKTVSVKSRDSLNFSKFSTVEDVILFIENNNCLKQTEYVEEKTFFKGYLFEFIKKSIKNDFNIKNNKQNIFILNLRDTIEKKIDYLKKLESFLKVNIKEQPVIVVTTNCQDDFSSDQILSICYFFSDFVKFAEKYNFNIILLSLNNKNINKTKAHVSSTSSFLKSLKKELPKTFFKHISTNELDEEKALKEVCEETSEFFDREVVYCNGERYVAVPKLIAKKENNLLLNSRSVILAIGGAKGITFSIIKNISKKYRSVLYLVGRSFLTDKIVAKNLKELARHNKKINYISIDACDYKSVDDVFYQIIRKHNKIDVVINGAGTVKIDFLKNKTKDDIKNEFNNKVLPAVNILNASLKYKPKKIIQFSSILSQYGSAGQSIYTSANAFIGSLTATYNELFESKGFSASTLHWPGWSGVGMTADKSILQNLKEKGVALIQSGKANELFLSALTPHGKEISYMNNHDNEALSFSLSNFEEYKNLIGKIQNPFDIAAKHPIFKKDFSLQEDYFLNEHKINGVSYVPGAFGISVFLCLGKNYFGDFPVLKNINIYNPIMVKNIFVQSTIEMKNENGVHLFSIESERPCFSAEIDNVKKTPLKSYLKEIKKEIAKKDIYLKYNKKNQLYLGKTFQSIEKFLIDKHNNVSAVIDNSKLSSIVDIYIYDQLILWIDAIFQTLGGNNKCHLTTIPTKIIKLSVFSNIKISQYLHVIPKMVKTIPEGVEGNLVVINEQGEVIIEAIGVQMKYINHNL